MIIMYICTLHSNDTPARCNCQQTINVADQDNEIEKLDVCEAVSDSNLCAFRIPRKVIRIGTGTMVEGTNEN